MTIPASAAVEFTLSARPDADFSLESTNETIAGENNGKITGVSKSMEYKLPTAEHWISGTGEEITDLIPGTYYVRIKATMGDFASNQIEVEIKTGEERSYTLNITAPAFGAVSYGYTQPEAKNTIINSVGNSMSTISDVAVDSKYFVVGGTGETVPAGETITTWNVRPVAGLDAGNYTAAITVTYNGGATATAKIIFTVDVAAQEAPAVPVLESKSTSQIKLQAVSDNAIGAKAEYSKDGGAAWQTSPLFENLSANTQYSFIVRYAATSDGNYLPSPASPALDIYTESSAGGSLSGGNSSGGSSSGGFSSRRPGWSSDGSSGLWRYYDVNGSYVRNAWRQVSENGVLIWYHFGADGYMNTGWFLDTDRNWYYLNPVSDGTKGAMKTGWYTDLLDNCRYYLDPTTGKMAKGWVQIDGIWYYFNESAPETSGWHIDPATNQWAYDPKAQTPMGALIEGAKR